MSAWQFDDVFRHRFHAHPPIPVDEGATGKTLPISKGLFVREWLQ